MRSVCEFRIHEEFAPLLFAANEGQRLSKNIRKLVLYEDDPKFQRVGELRKILRKSHNDLFFSGWDLRYEYDKGELAAAALFHLKIKSIFEPTGLDCGTQYDYSEVCPDCSVPRRQEGPLILDLRKAPKTKELACTLAGDEWIVSQHLAELLVDAGLTGLDLQRVRHKARYEDDAIDLRDVPSGRELIKQGEAAGYGYLSIEFSTWVARPAQHELWERARTENAEQKRARASRRRDKLPVWYQIILTSKPAICVPPTRFGINPFDDDFRGEYRCPRSQYNPNAEHVAGLNLLSEVSVARDSWDSSDICRTTQRCGWVLSPERAKPSPEPQLLISPHFRQVLLDNKIKGFKTDVAYLR